MPPDDPAVTDPPAAAPSPAASVEPAAAATAASAAAVAAPVDPAAAAVEKPADPAAAAAAPVKEFAPSLLDEAAKPTPEAKPGDAAPAKDAAKPEGDKAPAPKEPAADPAKPAEPTAPIEYAFQYPEGFKPEDVNAERMGAFTTTLNEFRASPEAGQKLLNMHLDEVKRVAEVVTERQWEAFANQQKQSREEVMADPELGGSRHATAIRTVMSFLDQYSHRPGPDGKARSADSIAAERTQLMDDFRATGIANRASLLRLLHWAGDKYVREGQARPAPPPRTPALTGQQRGLRRYQGTTPANGQA